MHKKMKLLVSMLAAAAMLVLLPGGSAMTASAEEAKTYSLKYIGGDINDWRYVPGSTFEEGMYHRELYYLKLDELKDGDHIVIYAGDATPNKELDLSAYKLGSLTIYQNAYAVVQTNGIRDCYVLAGAQAAINGDVTNAHLYDNVSCTFNNNVLDLVLHINGEPHSNISCAGTVGMFQILAGEDDSKGVFYDIAANAMKYVDGTIQFPFWSPSPSEAYLQAKGVASETPAAPEAAPEPSAPAPAGDASSEYDEVPKTGDSNYAAWLICLTGAAAALFAGSFILYRKAN